MPRTLLRLLLLLTTAACALGEPPPASSQEGVRGLDRSGPITYFIAEGSPESGFEEGDRTLAEWALEAWGRQANPPLEFEPAPEESATIRVYWVSGASGLYGEMRARVVDERPAADVFVLPDTDGLGPDIALAARADPLFRDTVVYLTCVHELGHAFGLAHTDQFADIMYTFQFGGDFVAYFTRFREQIEAREDIPRASPFSVADRDALRSLYRSAGG